MINFPSSPSIGQTYQTGSTITYVWNGSYWDALLTSDTVKSTNLTVDTALSSSNPIVTASYAVTASQATTASYAVTASNHSLDGFGGVAISSSYSFTTFEDDSIVAMVSDDVDVSIANGIAAIQYNGTSQKFLVFNRSASDYTYTFQGNLYQSNNNNSFIAATPLTETVLASQNRRLVIANVGAPENDAVTEEGEIKIQQSGKTWCYYVKALHDRDLSVNIIQIERIKDY